MKILLPPVFRWIALLLCLASFATPLLEAASFFPVLKARESLIPRIIFCTGILLFTVTGKKENKERWLLARKKAIRFAALQIVLVTPLMAFVLQDKETGWKWNSPLSIVTHFFLLFAAFTMIYFYMHKKAAIAE